jgi:hypothetical protein
MALQVYPLLPGTNTTYLFEDGYIIFDAMQEEGATPFMVGVESSFYDNGDSYGSTVLLGSAYGFVADGNWYRVSIPLTDLVTGTGPAGPGAVEYDRMTSVITIRASAGAFTSSIAIANLYWINDAGRMDILGDAAEFVWAANAEEAETIEGCNGIIAVWGVFAAELVPYTPEP